MPRQRLFTLVRATLALDLVDGKQRVVTLPADASILVHDTSADRDGLLTVGWGARSVQMFAVDLRDRGVEITDQAFEHPAAELPAQAARSGEWPG